MEDFDSEKDEPKLPRTGFFTTISRSRRTTMGHMTMVDTTKLEKVLREGGHCGVQLDGLSTMGGMQYVCATVDEPEGDLDLLAKSLEAMNAEPDESKEERTGGSGQLGKMIFSCDNGTICAIAYIPQSLKGQVDAEDWLKTILAPYNGMLVKASPVFSTGTIAVHPENGKSSREVRTEACHSAVKYLQQKGVYPDAETDSDSDGFGDEEAEWLDNL